MADTQKIIIAEIDIKVDGVLERQAAILAEQKKLKDQQKEYTEAVKQGNEITAAQTESYINSQAQIKNLSKEYSQNTQILAARQKVEMDGIKTVDDARAALSAVSIEWARATKIEGENSDKAKELAANKLALTERLKELESATGDSTRNVGNYSSALDGMSAKLGPVGGLLKSFATGSQTVGGALNSLGSTMKAIATNAFFIVIAVAASLFMAIKEAIGKNAEILDKLAVALKPVQLLFGSIMNTVGNLIELLVGKFADAMEWVADLFDGAENSTKKYTDAVKNLQDIEDKMVNQKIKDLQLQEEINKLDEIAADRTKTKEQRLNSLTESIKKQKEIAAENSKLQSEQLKNYAIDLQGTYGIKGALINKDLTLTQEALNKLSKEDKAALETQIENYINSKNRKSEIDKEAAKKRSTLEKGILDEEAAAAEKAEEARKKSNERIIKLLDYELKYFNATNLSKLKDNEETTAKIVDQENARIQKQFEIATKGNDKAFKLGLKSKQEYELAKIEIENNAEAQRQTLSNARLTQIQKDLDVEIREYKLSNESRLTNSKTLNAELVAQETLRLEDLRNFELAKLLLSTESEQEIAIKRKEINAQSDKEIADLNTQFTEQENTKKLEAQTIQAQAEFDLKQLQYQNEFEAERNQLKKSYNEQIKAATEVGADTKTITAIYEKAKTEIYKKENQARLGILTSLAGNLAELFGKETKMGKAAASAQVAIQTYQGAMSAWSAAQVFPAPFNAIVGGASVAATVALGAKSISDIWAVKTGLPEGGGGSGQSVNVNPSGGGGSSPVTPTNFDGGFANSSINGSSGQNQPQTQPVLIVDEVTYKQNHIASMSKVATL